MKLPFYPLAGTAWLALAVVAGATGAVARLQKPWPQVVLLGITAGLVIGYRRARGFRAWLDGLSLRTILGLHLSRLVGIYFLVLYGRGELPFAFAVPGGWGDIIAAIGALGVMAATTSFSKRRLLIGAWNVFGLLDILMVVITAARLYLAEPTSLRALLTLPLSLLPTFLVPLIIASHLLVFRRLTLASRASSTRTAAEPTPPWR